MDNHWSSDNWILSEKTDLIVLEAHVRVSKWIRNQISQVTQMSLFLERSAMSFTERIVMRSSCGTSVSQVSKFMNMDSVFAVRTKAFDWAGDFNGSCGVFLTEGNDTSDFWVVRVQDADGISGGLWRFGFVHEIGNRGGGAGQSQTEFSQHSRLS